MSNKPDIGEPSIGMTFREKSLWVTLVSTVVIYVYYFWRAIQLGDTDPGHLGELFLRVVISMIVIQTVIQAALAIHRRPEARDERDRLIALVSTRNSYYVLTTGVWVALTVCAMSVATVWIAHAALLAIVVAEVTRCTTQLIYYRRGLA